MEQIRSTGQSTKKSMHSKLSTNYQGTDFLDVNGIKVRYKVAGVGEQVFLLHGWGCSIESMGLVLDDFARDYAVLAIDFPGHGESELPPTPWGVSDYAELVLDVMDALHVQRPHIIAHSFGGRVTIKLASSNPDRVGKIILVNSVGIRPRRSMRHYLRVILAKTGKYLARYCGRLGETIRDRLYTVIASRDYLNAGPLRGTFTKIVNEDLTPILPHIKSPALLIWGENDKETPISSAIVMKKLIPQAELIIFKNAGHFAYIDQYSKFRLVVRRFLRE
jgi:pimeloyl-ACP methyl ester carboxylesterase